MQPDISVVIPSLFRPCLRRAVVSAQSQDWPGVVEIIVVVDGTETHDLSELDLPELERRPIQLIHTGCKGGAPSARNIGTAATTGRWIAFLDDDDEWLPNHLSATVRDGKHTDTVMSSRVLQVVDGIRSHGATPTVPKAPGTPVTDYLFLRRKPSLGRSSIFTSTLVVPATVGRSIVWDEALPRHQDWDYLLRAEAAGFSIQQVPDVTALIHVGTTGSISASSDWRPSLAWASEKRAFFARGTYSDFLAAQTLRYAIQSRSLQGVRETLAEIRRNGKRPHLGPMTIAASALAPRNQGFRAAMKLARREAAK